MSTASALPLSTQALLQAGLDHIHQGITIFDGELKMVGWNQRFLELLDFPESLAFEGATFESFMRFNAERGEYGPGDIETQVRTRVAEAARFLPHELERVRPDGLVLQVKGSPLPGGGFVAVYTDVTEQRSRERMLEKRISEHTEALRQSEARLRLIANEVPAGIAHCDQDLRFQFVNRRFANAYGFSQFEMIGRPADDILSEETMRVSRPFFEHARRGAAVDFDMTLKLPNG
ncbi:MAG: PAS-domain containing protein, partial [Hyphomicrobiaceae bacterium]|nr:PAS-domain containing protein [Rubrivivax sp.]MBL8572676.1 PAS-domain containing protein [Hyphomicrobiaceae bacterium]